ncbi:recombination protein O N-terminal domain-containing protein [Pseudomonas emilianonis]|uniref:recombination protein O N-terminal domain-containing protein n=1 Tax=Pseudomonas emilianonis TaxID=2915812 RepID=UPI0024A681FE|nr:recombination protein O N-terminal domain-containing protein [Pseudomonas emilianonis]
MSSTPPPSQPAYVLHSRAYRETSALVDFLTPQGRLRAVLRRSHPAAVSTQLELGDLCFSPVRGVVSIDNQEFTLTVSESRLLEALLRQPGEPLDKQELAQIALGRKLTLYDRSLDMHVSNLRKKIGPHPDGRPRIVALRSRGYYYSL